VLAEFYLPAATAANSNLAPGIATTLASDPTITGEDKPEPADSDLAQASSVSSNSLRNTRRLKNLLAATDE